MATTDNREELLRASSVIDEANDTIASFFDAFQSVRTSRGAKGAPTDEEQDLLRAALVFACAGLDSAVKHLIQDALPKLIVVDDSLHSEMETWAQRRIRDDAEQNSKYLTSVLLSPNPKSRLAEDYIRYLTGESLQSADQLLKILKAFGLSKQDVGFDKDMLDRIFGARNKIIHELDISGSSGIGQRKRNSRTKVQIQKDTETLIELSKSMISEVNKRLCADA